MTMKPVRGYGLVAGFAGEAVRAFEVDVRCPRCSSTMVKRVNRKTGELFLSCSFYPACRGHAQIEEA